LLILSVGTTPAPFIQTTDETSIPLALVGKTEIALIIGTGPSRQVAIASTSTGRIVRRLPGIDGATVTRLASSPDGRILYYGDAGKIWSVAATGGESRLIRDGDSVAVDPGGRYLIIQVNEDSGVKLVHVPLDGTPERALDFPGVRLTDMPLMPNAIREDGAILKAISLRDSFFFGAALLNPETGSVERISVPPDMDVFHLGWTPDGEILISAHLMKSILWRFTPVN
jgi:hypothetical protein